MPLSWEDIADKVGSSFSVALDDGAAYPLQLTDAARLPQGATARQDRQAFTLSFNGPGDRMLVQRTHLLRHAELGEQEIFLVPVGRNASDGRFLYQAIFN